MSYVRKIIAIDHHRNGVGGEPFDVVLFVGAGMNDEDANMVAVIFHTHGEMTGGPCTAVFDVNKLANGDIAFGSNSWRGDRFHADLMFAIKNQTMGK